MNSTIVLCVLILIAIAGVEHSSTLSFTTEPSDKVVAIGQPLLLNCQVNHSGSGRIVVSWQNNGIWLLNPVNQPWRQHINNSLYYSSIPARSIGTFRCAATNLDTSEIIYSRTATVQAAFIKPTYYTQPENATNKLGEDVIFDCVLAESLPYAFIHWEKNGQIITSGETSEFHIPSTNATSSALSLRNITFSSSGWYGCVAVNHLLPSQPQRSRKAFLSVLPAKDKPHINIHPSSMIVQEHKPAVVQCQILGIPMPVICWTQNGHAVLNTSDRYILSNGSLYFSPPVNRLYAGEYACTGTNSLGSVSSSPVLFSVAYLDFSFVTNPSNHTARVGDSVSIDCVPPLSFPPQVTIHWYHNYQQIVPTAKITVSSAGTITFAAIEKSDEGSYFCDATNVHLQETRTSTLAYVTVYVPPSFQGIPKDTNVTKGHPLVLHCQAIGFPLPGVSWLKDDKPVNTSHVTVFSNGSLGIVATVVQDAGKFSCVASNIAGSSITIAYVVIYVPPSVVSSPGNTTKTVGQSITFQCSFRGIPKPEVQWFYHSGVSLLQLINMSGKFVVSGGILEIKQITKGDEGSYICRAINVAGSVEASTYLKVQVPASLDTRLVNITVNESSPASFHCNASGDPKPSVTWFKDGRELAMSGRVVIGQDSLTIVNTVASDTGQYSCNVSNGLNSHLGVAFLLVQVSPNITSFHVPRLVALGKNASLTCAVSGIPQPRITWYRNGAQISMSRVHPRGNGMFVVDSVGERDGGVYACQAANAAGRLALSGNMTVQVPPSPPVPISAIPQSSRMIRLSWKAEFDGHSPITGYKVEVKVSSGRYETLESNISVTSYPASNLSPYTTYTFRIIALNAVGESLGTTISNRTLEDAPSQPRNLLAATLNASAITMTWNEPAHPNGQITWYEIHYRAVDNNNVTLTRLLPANRLPVLQAVIGRLTPFTSFQFRLRAATGRSGNLWGNFSSWSNATTGEAAPDASPQDILLEALSSRSILVEWKPVPGKTANGVVRKYMVYFQAVGPYRFSDARNFSVYGSLNLTLRTLHPWTQYNVSVQAFTVKAGPMSPWKQVQTLESVPGPPSNITLIPVSQHNITVLIAEPLPHMRNGAILGYTVFYRKASLPSNTSHLTVNTSSTRAALVNLTVYTEYAVHVAAYTSVGLGEPSTERTIFTQEGVPGTIEHVTAAALSHDSVLVSWLPPESANGVIVQYLITYNTSDGNSTGIVSTEGQQSINLTNLTPNTTYFIFVTAKTSQGFGRRGVTVNVTTRIYIVPHSVTSSPTTVPVDLGGTERRTGSLTQERIIIVVVCVGLVFVFMVVAAFYFCVVRPRKHAADGEGYTRSRKRNDLWTHGPASFEMDGGKHGRQAVLDVHEELSVADTNYSSDSFESDWLSSAVPSPSPKPPYSVSGEYANPADFSKRHAPDTAPRLQERNERVSQDSQCDQPYATVEELGGGFSSFCPAPPMAFRSTPLLQENSDTDSQTTVQTPSLSSDKRKSFTNQLYKAVVEGRDAEVGAEGVGYEGHQDGDMTGVENKGYDSDETLNELLGNEMLKSAASPEPSDLDALYSKPDKSQKNKTFRKNGVPSKPLSDFASDHEQGPTAVEDLYAKPDKSKKKPRENDKLKTSTRDGENDQSSSEAATPDHKPSVVYDERTNFSSEVAAPTESATADKHDDRSAANSTVSSETLTVSDMNSSDTQTRDPKADDLIDLNHEGSVDQVVAPPPSPFTLRNKKLSLGSQDSFYDEPYSHLEEIDANLASIETSPIPDVSPVSPLGEDVVAAEQSSGATKAMTEGDQTSFASRPFGVVDKPEDEAVIMEVKEIDNHTEPKADEDYDGATEPPKEPTGKAEDHPRPAEDQQRALSHAEEYDSVTLMV